MAKTKAKSPSGKLTPRQALFVQEYLKDLNATQAAIRAGYAEKTARVMGPENLSKPAIRDAVDEALAKRSGKIQVDAEWVLAGLKKNFERSMQEEAVTDKEGNRTGEYTYQGTVANRALELIGKHLGMFKEQHEHTGPDGKPIALAGTLTHDGSITLDAGATAEFVKQVLATGGPDLRTDDHG
jgi:phage terminase small subunit